MSSRTYSDLYTVYIRFFRFLRLTSISFLCLFLAFGAVFFPVINESVAYAQTTVAPLVSGTDPTAAKQAELQSELNDVLQQIATQQQALVSEEQQGESLQGDIDILNGQINEAQLSIKAHDLAIQTLGKNIDQKTQTISQLTDQMNATKLSLAQLIRQTNQLDGYSLVEVMLSNEDLSGFFSDLNDFSSVQQSIKGSLTGIQTSQSDAETAKEALGQQQAQETDEKISVQAEQAKIQASETQKAHLLNLNKAQQASYVKDINQKQAQAAAIRSALFSLRDTSSISFGSALQYAQNASAKTGVDPAFLLAILTQESNLGKNVGTCNRPGDPASKDWESIMSPNRDRAPYLQITSALGLDPNSQPLSCPQGGGYGGAMGPAQFIPSTWLLFAPRVAAAMGITGMPNPWDPQTAFMAAAIYLGDLGANSTSYTAQKNAACRYYSGRNCDSKKPANSFYGADVMAEAASIQTNMIDPIENAG